MKLVWDKPNSIYGIETKNRYVYLIHKDKIDPVKFGYENQYYDGNNKSFWFGIFSIHWGYM